MRVRPETLADGGCWISDDRVYAFVAARSHGLAEIGYHGLQPVSRNSRIFVSGRAAVECSVISGDGRRLMVPFDELEWKPGTVCLAPVVDGRQLDLEITASGKSLTLRFGGSSNVPAVDIRIARDSLFTAVQGERNWEISSAVDGKLRLSFRDRIVFNSWIRRSGPYSGDFLIPEPWRRIVFHRTLRSGEATLADVRPEYRDAPLALYDATTWVTIGGEMFTLSTEEDEFVFTAPARSAADGATLFEISFEDDPPGQSTRVQPARSGRHEQAERPVPRLTLPGYPHIEAFIAQVPHVVDSCIIRDYGVPRATPGQYYWIWAWDLMVTAVEMLRWGDLEGARRALQFVSSHRDINGRIPGRWTRQLQPLDTPEEGAGLEFLLAHLAYELFLETRCVQDVLAIYPTLVQRFRTVQHNAVIDGLVRGRGFYPDLPGRYGRSDKTVTALESGCWYGLCRILQNLALELGDMTVARETGEAARHTRRVFSKHFWDPARGTWQDAVDTEKATGTGRHPLFAYLCLQTPLAFSLIGESLSEICTFIGRELVTEDGLRTVPLEERGDGAEVILDAWYPHWDLYALRLLRKAGEKESLRHWLTLAENTLAHLGYCPEFLSLEAFRAGDPLAWKQHGAPSNLNCATGWYRALLETLFGLEFDPGGLTLGTAAPVGPGVSLQGLAWRQGTWDINLLGAGPSLIRCLVDGADLGGVRKIPRSLSGPGHHRLELHYGSQVQGIVLREITNAEILFIERAERYRIQAHIRLLGPGEILVESDHPATIRLNGLDFPSRWDKASGSSRTWLDEPGEHRLEITTAGQAT